MSRMRSTTPRSERGYSLAAGPQVHLPRIEGEEPAAVERHQQMSRRVDPLRAPTYRSPTRSRARAARRASARHRGSAPWARPAAARARRAAARAWARSRLGHSRASRRQLAARLVAPRGGRPRSGRCPAQPSPPAGVPRRGCPRAWPAGGRGRACEHDVVRPLDQGVLSRDVADRHRGDQWQQPQRLRGWLAVRWSAGAQEQRHQQRAVRRRRPAPALAPAPGALRGGGDERAVRRPRVRQLARAVVRRAGLAQVQARAAEAIGGAGAGPASITAARRRWAR